MLARPKLLNFSKARKILVLDLTIKRADDNSNHKISVELNAEMYLGFVRFNLIKTF